MIVSRHAKRRLKERLGLKHRAAHRHATIAFDHGVFAIEHPDWSIRTFYQQKQESNKNEAIIVYQGAVYIFGYDFNQECPILVTVYELPEVISLMPKRQMNS